MQPSKVEFTIFQLAADQSIQSSASCFTSHAIYLLEKGTTTILCSSQAIHLGNIPSNLQRRLSIAKVLWLTTCLKSKSKSKRVDDGHSVGVGART